MTFTAHEKWKAAERELALRRNVYPRRIAQGHMQMTEARRELELMAEIAEDYRKQAMDFEKEGTLL